MSGPTLYHVPRTISSPIYQAMLELNVVNNPVAVTTLTFADLKTPEHLARNPMGSSPAFTDDKEGIAIWESGAVLTYLLMKYDKECQLHPNPMETSSANLAKFMHLQQYIIATVYPFVASLFIHTLKPKAEQDESYVNSAKDKWRTLLAPTLATFLGSSSYFMGGGQLSAIDLLAAKPFNNAHALGMLEEFPTLYSLFQKVEALPSFSKAYNEVAPIHQTCVECRSLVLLPGDDSAEK